MKTSRFSALVLALCSIASVLYTSCQSSVIQPGKVADDYYPLILTTNVWTFGTTQRAGAVIPYEIQFLSYAPAKEINVYQVVNRTMSGVTTRDTTRIVNQPYARSFSATKQCDTLALSYTVPTFVRATGQTVAVNIVAEVVNQNGLFKRRAHSAANGFTWNP
jgi:hypothetical protein